MTKSKFPIETGEFIDAEDEDLIRSFEEGDWKPYSEPQQSQEIAKAKEAASNFLKKDKRINIRLNSYDLTQLKAKAAREGMPYQTLIGALIHKYVSGTIRLEWKS